MPRQPRARKKTSPKKRTRKATRTAARPAVSMDSLSAAQQGAVFRALAATLRQKGVRADLVALHFTDDTGDIGLLRCPPGQVRRMVCAKDANGVVVCAPRCVNV